MKNQWGLTFFPSDTVVQKDSNDSKFNSKQIGFVYLNKLLNYLPGRVFFNMFFSPVMILPALCFLCFLMFSPVQLSFVVFFSKRIAASSVSVKKKKLK